MDASGDGLVVAAPVRPSQAVGDGLFVVPVQVQESSNFGERQWDQASSWWWCGFVGFRFLSCS
jgi:hypothetical protein